MIQITIPNRGIIHLPIPPADDAMTIQGLCAHGESLLVDCAECQDCERWQSKYGEALVFWQNRSELFSELSTERDLDVKAFSTGGPWPESEFASRAKLAATESASPIQPATIENEITF